MKEIVNYMLEANLGLLLFLLSYRLILSKESSFQFLRFFMLSAIAISLVFPLFKLTTSMQPLPPVISIVPANWLPEVVISINGPTDSLKTTNVAYDIWQIALWIYLIGAVSFLIILFYQLRKILKIAQVAPGYQRNNFKIIETDEDVPTFSFFHLVLIGHAKSLSESEKQQIINHESVHSQQLHSIDILLTTFLQIVFWFNPFIVFYKKIFVQLHEFEADARAVENSDVNKYCSLLARVALQSVHFPIASHFNQSLTLKRINMIRTIKKSIRPWKFGVLALVTALSFFIISCHDQIADDISKSTISQTSDYPPVVKADMDAYMKDHKDAKLTYMEGIPDEIDRLAKSLQGQNFVINSYDISSGGIVKKGLLLSNVTQFAEQLQTEDKIFMVVEQQPEFIGGYDAMRNFIRANMHYPEDAKSAGKTGTVYVSMVINTDGSVTDTKVLRGIYPSLDAESARVISIMPKWKPGMQNGKAVKCRFNLPVRWENSPATDVSPASELSQTLSKMNISISTAQRADKIIIEGTVIGEDGKPLSRTTVLVKGTTTGAKTDEQGRFALEPPKSTGELVFSYIGYESQTLSY
jgi:TonB family protein